MTYIIRDKAISRHNAPYEANGDRTAVYAQFGRSEGVTAVLDAIDSGLGWGYPADEEFLTVIEA